MKTAGFLISRKENEKRRALLPKDLNQIRHRKNLFFEKGYGEVLGISDAEYLEAGANVCAREEALTKDIIVDPKVGDAEYLWQLKKQTVFGWLHAVQNRHITDALVKRQLTAFAWEDMFYNNRHIFYRNNELAGEAAIMHAFQFYGDMPYNLKVALLGRGNVASGALKILTLLGADVTVYSSKMEKLFQEELPSYDVVVNAILWDTDRKDHIIYRKDLSRMKKGAMIIDISCDTCGGVESSMATTIENPVYIVDGILHYAVDHTPSIYYKTATQTISEQVSQYMDELIEETHSFVLKPAMIVRCGMIVDQRIVRYQNRS